MRFYSKFLLIGCLALDLSPLHRAGSQEALGLKSEEAEAEPSPIPQPPAEGPQKKSAERGLSEREQLIKNIQQTITPEEFDASGLNKLSNDELRTLQDWLRGYRKTAEAKAEAQADKKVEGKVQEEVAKKEKTRTQRSFFESEKIYSRVEGNFKGLTGRTIIKLEDGTVWKQADQDDIFPARITDRPPVAISHNFFGYKMIVVGAGGFYVKPVRQ